MKKQKQGELQIPFPVKLEKHEIDTLYFLLSVGKNIEVIKPTTIKTPDIMMDNKFWEIKCPLGKGKSSLEHLFRKALHQSNNLIFSLFRCKQRDEISISKLKKYFQDSKSAKNLIIITKEKKMIFLKK